MNVSARTDCYDGLITQTCIRFCVYTPLRMLTVLETERRAVRMIAKFYLAKMVALCKATDWTLY